MPPLHPAVECPPSQLPSLRVPCLRCLRRLSIPSRLLPGLALELWSWLCCPASPSLPVPLSPPVPQLGGEPGRGAQAARHEGVPEAAVPSGPKPGCARQG